MSQEEGAGRAGERTRKRRRRQPSTPDPPASDGFRADLEEAQRCIQEGRTRSRHFEALQTRLYTSSHRTAPHYLSVLDRYLTAAEGEENDDDGAAEEGEEEEEEEESPEASEAEEDGVQEEEDGVEEEEEAAASGSGDDAGPGRHAPPDVPGSTEEKEVAREASPPLPPPLEPDGP